MIGRNSLGAGAAGSSASGLGAGAGGGGMDWTKILSALMGGSMFGQGIAGLFGGNQNPYEAGNPYYEKILNQLPEYFKPWTTAGAGALPNLQEQYAQLLKDPGAMFSKLAGGYKESPGYQFRQKQGQGAALNAAAAGGMAGTPQAQQQAAQVSEDIANQDFNDYMKNILGMYGMGLGGTSDLSKQGLAASMGLGEDLASVLARQAEAAIRGQETENKGEQSAWGNIAGGISSILPLIMKVFGL